VHRAALALALCAGCAAPREAPGGDLQRELEALVAGFEGTAGLYVRHLGTGETASIRADETFPTASLIKVPILIGVFERIERGELTLEQALVYEERRRYAGEDLLASFKEGERLTLSRLLHLMASLSDNTASLWCQELAGGGEAINAWLAAHGFAATRVNSRTAGREKEKEAWGWGQTAPREMAELLVMIREGRAVSPEAGAKMQRILSRSYWDGEALSAIPPGVAVASKQGAVDASRSEVVLVHAPRGEYVFCVITKDQRDRSWGADNAGFVLLREVSKRLWRRYGS